MTKKKLLKHLYDLGVLQAQQTIRGEKEAAQQTLEKGNKILSKLKGRDSSYTAMLVSFTAGYRITIFDNNRKLYDNNNTRKTSASA